MAPANGTVQQPQRPRLLADSGRWETCVDLRSGHRVLPSGRRSGQWPRDLEDDAARVHPWLCHAGGVPAKERAGGTDRSRLVPIGVVRRRDRPEIVVGERAAMALDFAADNIRVNCVCPGAIDTPMLRWAASLDEHPERVVQACHKLSMFGRMGRPEEIARVIAFLASDLASYISGTAITADGGLLTPTGGMMSQEAGTGGARRGSLSTWDAVQ